MNNQEPFVFPATLYAIKDLQVKTLSILVSQYDNLEPDSRVYVGGSFADRITELHILGRATGFGIPIYTYRLEALQHVQQELANRTAQNNAQIEEAIQEVQSATKLI